MRHRRPSRRAPTGSAGRSGSWRRSCDRTRSRTPGRAPARERPSQPARSSVMTSGVSVSETSVVTWSPTSRPMLASRPTSATVPVSMPPEPVTGLCILPRLRTMSRTSARTAWPSPPCLLEQLAERRRVEVEPGHVDPDLVGPELRVGVEPLGRLRQHTGRAQHPVQSGRVADTGHFTKPPESLPAKPQDLRCRVAGTVYSPVLWHENVVRHKQTSESHGTSEPAA